MKLLNTTMLALCVFAFGSAVADYKGDIKTKIHIAERNNIELGSIKIMNETLLPDGVVVQLGVFKAEHRFVIVKKNGKVHGYLQDEDLDVNLVKAIPEMLKEKPLK